MDMNALEIFSAFPGNLYVTDMMKEKLKDSWKKESYQNFWFRHYLISGARKEPFSSISNALYEDRFSDLISTIFPDSKPKAQPNNSWRSAFEFAE